MKGRLVPEGENHFAMNRFVVLEGRNQAGVSRDAKENFTITFLDGTKSTLCHFAYFSIQLQKFTMQSSNRDLITMERLRLSP